MKPRLWHAIGIALGTVVVAGGAFWVIAAQDSASSDVDVRVTEGSPRGSTHGAVAAPALEVTRATAPVTAAQVADVIGSYPVDLDELRPKLPDNRYWELGAPTSDVAVAQARAERARRANVVFGRTQTGEATRQEIRDYYAEQRRISEDYLELSLLVLAEKADELPERDRGLFELSASLHRARLTQIDRDLTDALARRGNRP